jgi:hypothetical protein
MFTFDTQHQTFNALPSDEFTRAIKDTVWLAPGLPLHPNPASTSFIMSTNVDDIDFGENEPSTPRIWKFTLSSRAASQEFDVEPHLKRIFEEKRVEFYLFCMASGRMFFLGSRGKSPMNGSVFLGEVIS